MVEPHVPDVYADQFTMVTTDWGTALTFGAIRLPAVGTPPTEDLVVEMDAKVTVRMSLQHAKAMAIVMMIQLKAAEAATGSPIVVRPETIERLHITPEDWAW